MTNRFYNDVVVPAGSKGRATQVNQNFAGTEAGFDLVEAELDALNTIAEDAETAKSEAEESADRAEAAATRMTQNFLYNPEFEYSQRVDFMADPSSITANGFIFDRWGFTKASGGDVVTHSRQNYPLSTSGLVPRPRYFARVAVVAGGSTTPHSLYQALPGARSFTGQQMTFSTMVRCSLPNTINLVAYQNFGTGGTPSAPVIFAFQPFSHDGQGFQVVSATFTVPDVTNKTFGTNDDDSLILVFQISPNVSCVTDFALNMLQFGDARTQFARQKYGDDLDNCRYFYRVSASAGLATELSYQMHSTPTQEGTGPYGYNAEL